MPNFYRNKYYPNNYRKINYPQVIPQISRSSQQNNTHPANMQKPPSPPPCPPSKKKCPSKKKFNFKSLKKNTCTSLNDVECFLNKFSDFIKYVKIINLLK